MRTAQKLIKFFAIALAIFLIITMFTVLVGGVSFLGVVVGGEDWNWNNSGEWVTDEFAEQKVTKLSMSVKATNVRIKVTDSGEPVRVETNNEHIETWVDEGAQKLNVVEKSHGFLGLGGVGEVVVYVREGFRLDDVEIGVGAGTLDIEKLETRELDLDLGAGRTRIEELRATDNVSIHGGAGVLEIRQGELRDARIDLGAGKADIRTRLRGHSKVEAGVGRLDLELLGRQSDYRIKIDKGLGSVRLDGQKMEDNAVAGDGNDVVEVESGVGAVEISIIEE